MENYSESQRGHYSEQYETQEVSTAYSSDDDLWEWAKWYPLLEIDDFLATLHRKSLLSVCCGAGRELGLFKKHGVIATATDLTVEHLFPLMKRGLIDAVAVQDAERLDYPDDSFDYGFVNAGLHHLQHPHAGLCELMRISREAVIFIENQDSLLHGMARFFGRRAGDYEPAGNYVYRWKRREVKKIALSAHAHSCAIRTAFLPISTRMRNIHGGRKRAMQAVLQGLDRVLGRIGNLMIVLIFKKQPTKAQLEYLSKHRFEYRHTRLPNAPG